MEQITNYDEIQVEFLVRENPRPGPHYKLQNGTLKVFYELTQEQMDEHIYALLDKNQKRHGN